MSSLLRRHWHSVLQAQKMQDGPYKKRLLYWDVLQMRELKEAMQEHL